MHKDLINIAAIVENAAKTGVSEALSLASREDGTAQPPQIGVISQNAVADALGVVPATLRRWHKSGILKKIKIGRRVYYRLEDIKNLIDERRGQE